MLPFDERIPEEGRQEHEALIAFLHQAYRHPLDDGAREEREQALLRVRERLLRYEDSEMPGRQTAPLYVVDNKAGDTGSAYNRARFSPKLGGKNRVWGVRRRMIMAIAVVVLLVGSMAVLLRAVQQSKSGSGGTHLPVLTEFEGTGSQTLSDLNLALPQGRGVGVDLSCDGPGSGSVALYNASPLLSTSGDDHWQHPRLLAFNFSSCSILNSSSRGYEMGVGDGTYTLTYTLHEVQVKVDPATSWKLKVVSYPISPPPNLHLPTLALPKSQVPIGEFAGTGGKILVPSTYSTPIDFLPAQPWQLHLVCRGPGKVHVTLDTRDTYQRSSKYKDRLPPQLAYTVPCGASAPASISPLFPPLASNVSNTVVVDVSAESDVNWHWVLGMCQESSMPGCQSPLEKP